MNFSAPLNYPDHQTSILPRGGEKQQEFQNTKNLRIDKKFVKKIEDFEPDVKRDAGACHEQQRLGWGSRCLDGRQRALDPGG